MKVAIVVPVLDEAGAIGQCLAALQQWRAAGHLVIVADGGSADATIERALPFCDSAVRAPRGRARQMNAGAAAADAIPVATGPIDAYLFLHADTRLPDHAIEQLTHAIATGVRCWGRFDVRIAGHSRWLPLVAALMNIRSRLTGIATGDQAIFLSRDAFKAVGGFPDWPLMEDIGMSRALKRLTPPAALRARVITSGRRWDANGPLRTIVFMWWLRLRFALGAAPETLAARYSSVR